MSGVRKWLPIVGGVAVLMVFALLGAAWFGVSWFREHVDIAGASRTDANAAFDEVTARFQGRPPLIELRGLEPKVNKVSRDAARSAGALSTLHVVAFDPDDQQLARVDVPFWLVRLKSGPIRFSSYAAGLDNVAVSLTADDIERYGPGIIIDAALPRGARAIVWVE